MDSTDVEVYGSRKQVQPGVGSVGRIRDYITHWNSHAGPFVWTATTDEILAKVLITQTNIKKLVENNQK